MHQHPTDPTTDPSRASSADATSAPNGATIPSDRPRRERHQEPQQLLPTDDQVRALLLHLARQLADTAATDTAAGCTGGQAATRLVGCLTGAADELLDPLRPAPLAVPEALAAARDLSFTPLWTNLRSVRDLLLDHRRDGTVRQVLARGRAARELAQALHLLDQDASQPEQAARSSEPVPPGGSGGCRCRAKS